MRRPDWPAALAAHEAEVAGYEIHDLGDIAVRIGEIALTIKWAGIGLGKAYAAGADQEEARRVAVLTLLRAFVGLSELVEDLAAMRLAP